MIIRHPFIIDNIEDVIKKQPYQNTVIDHLDMMRNVNRISSGETVSPSDWAGLLVGHADSELIVDYHVDANTEERKGKISKDVTYIPILQRSRTEQPMDCLFYFTDDIYLLCQCSFDKGPLAPDESYISKSLCQSVYEALLDMGCDVSLLFNTITINKKMVARFMKNNMFKQPYRYEEMYLIINYDDIKFRAAMSSDLYGVYGDPSCAVVVDPGKGVTGIINEHPKFNDVEFFQKLFNHIFEGKK